MAIMAPSALVSTQFRRNKLGGSSLWFIARVCKHIGVQSHTHALERTTVWGISDSSGSSSIGGTSGSGLGPAGRPSMEETGFRTPLVSGREVCDNPVSEQ